MHCGDGERKLGIGAFPCLIFLQQILHYPVYIVLVLSNHQIPIEGMTTKRKAPRRSRWVTKHCPAAPYRGKHVFSALFAAVVSQEKVRIPAKQC